MKRTLIILGVIALIIIIIYSTIKGTYNNMVTKSEDTKSKWSQVESQYQRRFDMYTSIVNTVQSSAAFEKSTLQAVVEARAKATSVTVDASKLTPESIEQFQKAQEQLSTSFNRLLATFERYPDLKTTSQYQDFQTNIAGTENRINKARNDFTISVQDYNTFIKQFPNNLFAGMFGFSEKGYFKAAEGSDKNIPGFSTEEKNPEVKQ